MLSLLSLEWSVENELWRLLKTKEVLRLHTQQRPLALSRKSVEIVEALTPSENRPKFVILNLGYINVKHFGLPSAWLSVVQVIPRQPSRYLYPFQLLEYQLWWGGGCI